VTISVELGTGYKRGQSQKDPGYKRTRLKRTQYKRTYVFGDISLFVIIDLSHCETLFELVSCSAKLTWNVVLRESIASFSDSFKNFHLKFVTYLKVLSSEIL
jgi:hypothetical protein